MTQCHSGDATIIEGLWAGRGKMLVCLHLHLLKYLETLQVHPCRSWEPLPFSEAKGQQVRPCRYEEEPQRAFQKELEPRVPPAPQGTLKGRPETCSVYHEPCWEAGVKGSPQLLSGIIPPQRLCFCVFRYRKENVLFHCLPNGPGLHGIRHTMGWVTRCRPPTAWTERHNGVLSVCFKNPPMALFSQVNFYTNAFYYQSVDWRKEGEKRKNRGGKKMKDCVPWIIDLMISSTQRPKTLNDAPF